MNRSKTSIKGQASNVTVAALSLLMTASVSCQVASAQDYPSSGSYSSSSSLGPDQDSLLPPEVVPLDLATANSLSAAQADKRQSSFTGANSFATEGSIAPGLVPTGLPEGMQSAKDARNAAFNSLYAQGQLPLQPQSSGFNQGYILGQTPMNGSGSGQYGSPPSQQAMPTQSQMLSGRSKNQPKIRDIKRAGISNTVSALAGFAGGAMTAGSLLRPYGGSAMGLGMYGLTMTGFGVRNAFRF